MKIRFAVTNMSEFLATLAYQLGTKKRVEHGEEILDLPATLGVGTMRGVQLRQGCELMIFDSVLAAPLHLEGEYIGHQPLGLSFCLSGSVGHTARGALGELGLGPNQRGLFFMPDFREGASVYAAHQRTVLVGLGIEPSLSHLLCEEQLAQTLSTLRHVGVQAHEQFFFQAGSITPSMRTVLTQVLQCPYQGEIKRLYLESKALELIALSLTQTLPDEELLSPHPSLRPDDIERIHAAREVLLRTLEEPPSLLTLARQVGLNDFKLKRGFRQVFGTTVFGYVRDQRMARARQLLEGQRLNVTEVACAVGYANPSQFAAAFKQKFGLNPLAYRTVSLRKHV
jgi:AraC-like DNA-binding protein